MTRYHSALDQRFQALADPTRRAIVERLINGPAQVTDLAHPFGMALPTVLQHLKVLEHSGLIRSRKQGRVRTCELNPEALRGVEDWFSAQLRLWESRLDRLDSLAERLAQDASPRQETPDD